MVVKAGYAMYIAHSLFNMLAMMQLYFCDVVMLQKGISNKTQPESKCPELLANYCDMLLRKTPLSKKLTADEIEKKLKDVVSVLLVKVQQLSVPGTKYCFKLSSLQIVDM